MRRWGVGQEAAAHNACSDMIIGGTFDWPERFGLVAIEEPAK
jgi:hypothetical protein